MKKPNNCLWYLAIVFAVSYLLQYVIFRTGGVRSPLFPILMWIPGIAALVFMLMKRKSFSKVGWGLKKWWFIFPAILIPLTIALSAVLFMEAFGWASFIGKLFTFKNGMVEISSIKLLLGNQSQNIPFFILNIFLSHVHEGPPLIHPFGTG